MKDEVGKVQVLSQETAADGHQFCVPTVFWRPRLYVVVWVGGGIVTFHAVAHTVDALHGL